LVAKSDIIKKLELGDKQLLEELMPNDDVDNMLRIFNERMNLHATYEYMCKDPLDALRIEVRRREIQSMLNFLGTRKKLEEQMADIISRLDSLENKLNKNSKG
jgi:hypothetical protein